MSSSAGKLTSLRAAMRQNGLDVYIITLTDPHLEEEIPDYWQIIRWLTGFSGSAATVVITETFAGLWTDSRYFIQGEKQIAGSGFELVRPNGFLKNDYLDYLDENILPKSKIGIDGRIFSISRYENLKKRLEKKKVVIDTAIDLITDLWTNRPDLPFSMAFDHPLEFCGTGRAAKINEVRKQLKKCNTEYHLLTSPGDIMWLLNIRGSDTRYSPLITCFALICPDQILLFADESKIPLKLAYEFDKLSVVILPYEDVAPVLAAISDRSSVLVTPATTSVALYNSIPRCLRISEGISVPCRLKAIKNPTEIASIGKVMVMDGIALSRFFYWFDNYHGEEPLTEQSLVAKLLEYRSQQENFLGPSFASIAAFNMNAASPHYSPDAGSDALIRENGILLIDSGGQYLGGTTDITRTIATGVPTPLQKKDFTLVLKSHIDLAMAKFPYGTCGYQLDSIARRVMWNSGLNFGHGTGHGVGFCLNVHEGPQSISPACNNTIFEPAMLTSNEPAIYRDGEYGIRTENLILCYEDEETEFGRFLKFDTLSLCHIDKTLIDIPLLDSKEIKWLNDYHREVYEKISPFLPSAEQLWLKEKTEAIDI